MALHALCLCDGYGGFELGLKLAGLDIRTVARVERDNYAAATLVARMEEARLDLAPVWDDLSTFDGAAWSGRVDLVTAGFPCQPFSAAGQRRGVDDERWLWPDIARIIADVGPRYVFLENVPGLVRHGLPHVLADLALLGFDAEWGLYAASDVGAPHRRQRFWLLAVLADDDNERFGDVGRSVGEQPARGHVDRPGGEDVADGDGARRQGSAGLGEAELGDAGRGSGYVGNTDGARRPEVTRGALGDEGADGRRTDAADVAHGADEDVDDAQGVGDESGQRPGAGRGRRDTRTQAPDRNVVDTSSVDEREPEHEARAVAWGDAWADSGGRCFPPRPDDELGWRRWIDGGGPEPQLRRLPDGRPPGLVDALHLGGNGLVPACAAEAFRQLAERLGVVSELGIDSHRPEELAPL